MTVNLQIHILEANVWSVYGNRYYLDVETEWENIGNDKAHPQFTVKI
jgi:hypothetical protein